MCVWVDVSECVSVCVHACVSVIHPERMVTHVECITHLMSTVTYLESKTVTHLGVCYTPVEDFTLMESMCYIPGEDRCIWSINMLHTW